MGWADNFLSRFRRAGTPAPPREPVDQAAEAAAELQTVLSLLAETESACSKIRRRAEADAEELRERARATAAARRELAEERLSGYVARVVATVRTAGEEPAGAGAAR